LGEGWDEGNTARNGEFSNKLHTPLYTRALLTDLTDSILSTFPHIMQEWQSLNIVAAAGVACGVAYFLASQHKPRALRRCLQVLVGVVLFLAGLSKLAAAQGLWFPAWLGPAWLGPTWLGLTWMSPTSAADRLAERGFAALGLFAPYAQVLAGLLLLSRRFATLGAVVALPICVVTALVALGLGWHGAALVAAAFALIVAGLLVADWSKLRLLMVDADEMDEPVFRLRNGSTDALWVAGAVNVVVAVLALVVLPASAAAVLFYVCVGVGVVTMFVCAWLYVRAERHKEIFTTDDAPLP
jgi:hypothetical protein